MTASPLSKAFLLSVCLGGGLFALATLPLVALRSQPIEVQVQNRTVLDSEIKRLSGPYLGAAGAFSAALGAGVLAISGWRLAGSKLEQEKIRNSDLKKDVLAYQAQLERIKFSDSRLHAQGLNLFLEENDTPALMQSSQMTSSEGRHKRELALVQPTPVTQLPSTGRTQHQSSENNASAQQLDSVLGQLQMLAEQVEAIKTEKVTQIAA